MIHTIKSEALTVSVSEKGAELQSIRDGSGTEFLWQGDPKYWSGRAPTIFPYVARLTGKQYTLFGKTYSMGIHGFARTSTFSPIASSESAVTLRLTDNEETRAQYPYSFVFDVTYSLSGNCLTVKYEVTNRSETTMYFGIGGHPGFNVPNAQGLRFEDYCLEFREDCSPRRVAFTDDCFVAGGDSAYPLQSRRIPLRHELFDHDAVVLRDAAKSVSLFSDKGGKCITVTCPDMTYLGFWHATRTDAPYVCIEPWSSLPARKDMTEDFSRQNDLKQAAPGETYRNVWTVDIR